MNHILSPFIGKLVQLGIPGQYTCYGYLREVQEDQSYQYGDAPADTLIVLEVHDPELVTSNNPDEPEHWTVHCFSSDISLIPLH